MGEGQAGRTALRCPLPETRERRTEGPGGEDPRRASGMKGAHSSVG